MRNGGFFTNLFGTIAQNSGLSYGSGGTFGQPDFIPIGTEGENGQENILKISGRDAQWLGLENRLQQKYAYEYCFALAAVVDRLAEADTNGVIQILRKQGKGAEDFATSPFAQRMNRLFEQPNPSQSWEEFRAQQKVYMKIYGYCPVLPVLPIGFTDPSEATMLLNLPPWFFDVKPLMDGSGFPKVDHYICNFIGKQLIFQPNELMMLTDSFVMDEFRNYLLPKSKLVGLDMAVSNLCVAMEADNVLLRKKGPLGFISHDSAATKDNVAGYLPMTEKEKREIQGDLAKYGLNWAQYQYVVSRQAIKWNSMSFDVKQLGTKETITQSVKAICWRYNYDYVLLENTDATYANGNTAGKALYQNNVIPGSIKDMHKYEKYFGFADNNCKLNSDFSHLPVLQEDAQEQGKAKQYANTGLQIEYLNDIITVNEWRTAQGYDTIPDGDVYYSQSQLNKQKADAAAAQQQIAETAASQQSEADQNK
jgi:hypothetical protein